MVDLFVHRVDECRHRLAIGVLQREDLNFRLRLATHRLDLLDDLADARDGAGRSVQQDDSQFRDELDLHVAEQSRIARGLALVSSRPRLMAGRSRGCLSHPAGRVLVALFLHEHPRHEMTVSTVLVAAHDWFHPRRSANQLHRVMQLTRICITQWQQLSRSIPGRRGVECRDDAAP